MERGNREAANKFVELQLKIKDKKMEKSQADKIREYCRDTRIIPARARGEKTVAIRAGDICNELHLQNRTPNVCSSLQSLKFEKFANVKRISIEGPGMGTNCIMTFKVL